MEKFNKFKQELETLKKPTVPKNDSSKNKNIGEGNNTNNICENTNINKKEDDDKNIDYSKLISNLDELYKEIKQGNINLVIDKKPNE